MSREVMYIVFGSGAVICSIALIVIAVVQRRSDKAMLRAMTGEERYRMTGQVQIGHKLRCKGYVAFCADGLVVHTKEGEAFAPYRKTRGTSVKGRSVRFVADGIGSVIVTSEHDVPMDRQIIMLRRFGIML